MPILPTTPPKFHPGQAVICLDPAIPHETCPTITYHMDISAVYHVSRVGIRKGKWHIMLVENHDDLVFEEIHFAPAELLPSEAVAALLAESLDPVAV